MTSIRRLHAEFYMRHPYMAERIMPLLLAETRCRDTTQDLEHI